MNNTNVTSNEFKEKLELETQNLKRCQQEHSIDSCLKCQKLIGCEVRATYVKAVYLSMNKGKGGGFEF